LLVTESSILLPEFGLGDYSSARVRGHLCRIFAVRPSVFVGNSRHVIDIIGVPNRIRTGVAAVKGRCPGPLDDGDVVGCGAMGLAAAAPEINRGVGGCSCSCQGSEVTGSAPRTPTSSREGAARAGRAAFTASRSRQGFRRRLWIAARATAAPGTFTCRGGGAAANRDQPASGQARLSSWPSGSVIWKKRSPQAASRGAVSGRTPAANSRA
jgi:hypothetical protein